MVAITHSPATYEGRDYGDVMRRRWWIVVAGAVLGLLVAMVATKLLPKSYTSPTSVLVLSTPVPDAQIANSRTSSDINLDTESQLVLSMDVAAAAGKLLHSSQSPRDLATNVTVTVPPNTQVLQISYSDNTARKAQQGSHAFALAYLANRQALSKAALDAQIKGQQAQVVDLTKRLQDATGKLATLPTNSPDRAFAQAQVQELINQVGALEQKVSSLTTTPVTPGRIISDAELPTGPGSPNTLILLSGGLMTGLLLGFSVAVLRERTDKRIRRGSDVERLIDVPLLTALPGRALSATTAAGIVDQSGAAGAAIAHLRNTVIADLGPHRHVLLVVGASTGPASQFLATNLTASLARAGLIATLMAANLRDAAAGPTGSQQLGVSDFMLRELRAQELTTPSADVQSMNIVGPGTQPGLGADRMQTDRARELVADLLANANYVVILASSTAISADAQTLAHLADGVIVVAELGRTRKDQLLDAGQQLERVGARVLGAAVVPPIGRRRGQPGTGGNAATLGRAGRQQQLAQSRLDAVQRDTHGAGEPTPGGDDASTTRRPAPFKQEANSWRRE